MPGHRKIHQVGISQVNLGNTAGSLHDNGIITRRKAVKSVMDFFPEINIPVLCRIPFPGGGVRGWLPPIIIGTLIAYGLAMQYYLRGMV